MGKKKLHITRRVRGTTLTFDSMGRPKVIHTNLTLSQIAERRKQREAALLEYYFPSKAILRWHVIVWVYLICT